MALYNFYIEHTVSIRKRDYFSVESNSLDNAINDANSEKILPLDSTLLENTINKIPDNNSIVYDSKLIKIKKL